MLKKIVFLTSMLFVVSCASTTEVASTNDKEQEKVAKKQVDKKVGEGCKRKITGSRMNRC